MDMSRIRIEGLLAAFPKLVGTGKQHTYVETENVRYVFQPMEVGPAAPRPRPCAPRAAAEQRGRPAGAVHFLVTIPCFGRAVVAGCASARG